MRIRIVIAAHTRANLENLAHNLKLTLQGNGMVERDPAPVIEVESDEPVHESSEFQEYMPVVSAETGKFDMVPVKPKRVRRSRSKKGQE